MDTRGREHLWKQRLTCCDLGGFANLYKRQSRVRSTSTFYNHNVAHKEDQKELVSNDGFGFKLFRQRSMKNFFNHSTDSHPCSRDHFGD